MVSKSFREQVAFLQPKSEELPKNKQWETVVMASHEECLKDKIKYAQFLHDASEVQITEQYGHWGKGEMDSNDVNLRLPVNKPPVEIPVIEVFLKE